MGRLAGNQLDDLPAPLPYVDDFSAHIWSHLLDQANDVSIRWVSVRTKDEIRRRKKEEVDDKQKQKDKKVK